MASDENQGSNQAITLIELYAQQTTWQGKAVIMGVFHVTMCLTHKDWNLTKTADKFNVSIGLVSENVKLMRAMDSIGKYESRHKALKKLR